MIKKLAHAGAVSLQTENEDVFRFGSINYNGNAFITEQDVMTAITPYEK